jgi:putative addiction module component (TIGR02574 family)
VSDLNRDPARCTFESIVLSWCLMTRSQLLPEIFKLDPSDQLLVAEAIRNHLAGIRAPVDESEFRAELDRRVLDADANPLDESPLKDVISRLRMNK